MRSIKKICYVIVVVCLMLTFFACQETKKEDSTYPTTITYNIPDMLNDGLNFIKNRDSYLIHTMMDIDADYYQFITKHRQTVLFDDSFLKANFVDEAGEVFSRIGIIDEKAYNIYKQGTTYIRGDELNSLQQSMFDFHHFTFDLLESATIDMFNITENIATFSYTYDDILEKAPVLLQAIDEWMNLEIDEATDVDLSSVNFEITITMTDDHPNSFYRIAIDIKDYVALKYPLESIPQDNYREARLIYEFAYETYTKDITAETVLQLDDHPNGLSDQATLIAINQDATLLGQYQYDFDWFKIILTETKTLTFETNETLHTVYSFYNANDLSRQIGLFNGSPYELDPGTYYISVLTTHDVSTQITFSLNEQ